MSKWRADLLSENVWFHWQVTIECSLLNVSVRNTFCLLIFQCYATPEHTEHVLLHVSIHFKRWKWTEVVAKVLVSFFCTCSVSVHKENTLQMAVWIILPQRQTYSILILTNGETQSFPFLLYEKLIFHFSSHVFFGVVEWVVHWL